METTNRVKGLMDEEAAACLNPEKWVEGGTRESVIEQFFKGKEKKVKISEPKKLFKMGDDVIVAGKKLIKELSRHGITAIPFCVHQGKDTPFCVQGHSFKWHCVPMAKYKEAVSMPDKEWESLKKLEKSGVKHDGVFIAVPMQGDAMNRILTEWEGMTESAGKGLLALLAAPFLMVMPVILPATFNDPVLLVKFPGLKEGDLFLEIGRWD